MTETNGDITDDDVFHILVATDIHLGYLEDDPIRGDDTFVTFEEILQTSVRENVDFILLGGDLFHDAKPTNYCINKCIELIKKYCYGNKPIKFATISDQSYNFLTSQVNYEDPNQNISIPIFSIHGNHDDPIGKKQISSINLLNTCGLINYFGYWTNITNIEIYPILLKKGNTNICLYGLSHVKDQRLARLFLDDKVVMKTIDDNNNNGWFNLFVLHQNRADRGIKNFIPDTAIPEFIDLCIWGHEHDCKIDPVHIGRTGIMQPGSSIATSLSQGESLTKRIGILHIYHDQYKLDTFELKTVRPFIYDEFYLNTYKSDNNLQLLNQNDIQTLVKDKIDQMLIKAKNLKRELKNPLPLIRLIVKYDNDRHVFNTIKFTHQFIGIIANNDIVKFSSIKARKTDSFGGKKTNIDNDDDDVIDDDRDDLENIDEYLTKYLIGNNELDILSINGLNESIKRYINCKDIDSIPYIIDWQLQETLKQFINQLQPNENQIVDTLEKLKLLREQKDQDLYNQLLNDPNRLKSHMIQHINDDDDNIIIDDDDGGVPSTSTMKTTPPPTTTKKGGKGSRGGRGSRGGKGSRGKRGQ